MMPIGAVQQKALLEDVALVMSTVYEDGKEGRDIDFRDAGIVTLRSMTCFGAVLKLGDNIIPLVAE